MVRNRRSRDRSGWLIVLFLLVVLGITAAIYLPVIANCNARGGEVVRNWANWPVCISTK